MSPTEVYYKWNDDNKHTREINIQEILYNFQIRLDSIAISGRGLHLVEWKSLVPFGSFPYFTILGSTFLDSTQKRLPIIYQTTFLSCWIVRASRVSIDIFKNMWLKLEGFLEKVQMWWSSYNFSGTPKLCFGKKIKSLEIRSQTMEQGHF